MNVSHCLIKVDDSRLDDFLKVIDEFILKEEPKDINVPDEPPMKIIKTEDCADEGKNGVPDEPPLKIFKSEGEALSSMAVSFSQPGLKILKSDIDPLANPEAPQEPTEKFTYTWICANCSFKAIKPQDLGIAPIDDGSGSWACNACSKVYTGKNAKGNATAHFRKAHEEQPTIDCIPCPRCEIHFQVLKELQGHLKSDHQLDYKTLMKNEKVRH